MAEVASAAASVAEVASAVGALRQEEVLPAAEALHRETIPQVSADRVGNDIDRVCDDAVQ